MTNTKKNKEDLILCIDKETKEPVILTKDDRFFHTLIVGPTGCNKEKAFLPLIMQDMKNEDCGITVIEPMNRLTQKVIDFAVKNKRNYTYFDPTEDNGIYINPLEGNEYVVVERLHTFFNMIYESKDIHQYFKDCNERCLRNAIHILKHLDKPNTNLMILERFLTDQVYAYELIEEFKKMNTPSDIICEEMVFDETFGETELFADNDDDLFDFGDDFFDIEASPSGELAYSNYFENEYFMADKKEFNTIAALREALSEINSNNYIGKAFNPKDGDECIDFCNHLSSNNVLIISTANGKTENHSIGYLIMIMLQEASFMRDAKKERLYTQYLYIDNFHNYNNRVFVEMLKEGMLLNIICHLGVQSINQLGGYEESNYYMLSLIKNLIIFPGIDKETNDYFKKELNLKELFTIIAFNKVKYRVVDNFYLRPVRDGYFPLIDEV